MAKRGTPFQQVVADIMRAFGNVAEVQEGTWVRGPDGRRDRDVSFTILGGSRKLKVLIECKDYNRGATGSVGIEVIDGLDSKRRDLGIDVPMICSNAGFTAGALAKAQRVGIRVIGALRMGDNRIRFNVSDAKYVRKLTLTDIRLQLLSADPRVDLSKVATWEITLNGNSVLNWALGKIHLGLHNPITNGEFINSYRLIRQVILTTPIGDVSPTQINILFTLKGAWYEHMVTIDASNGFYDWARRVPTVSAMVGERKLQIGNVDPFKGEWIDRPPPHVLDLGKSRYLPGEVDLALMLVFGWTPAGAAADLDSCVDPADLIIQRQDYPPENTSSLRGYVHPKGDAPKT